MNSYSKAVDLPSKQQNLPNYNIIPRSVRNDTPTCDFGGGYIHLNYGRSIQRIPKCTEVAKFKYRNPEHPEWLDILRCQEHSISHSSNPKLIQTRL